MPTLVARTTRSRLALALSQLADDRLRLAAGVARHPARVHVGGVDEVEAGVDERVEQRKRGGLVGGPAEHVAAEGERRDLEAGSAERTKAHEVSLGWPTGLSACASSRRRGRPARRGNAPARLRVDAGVYRCITAACSPHVEKPAGRARSTSTRERLLRSGLVLARGAVACASSRRARLPNAPARTSVLRLPLRLARRVQTTS